MRVCVVWGDTKCVILIVEAPPCCLCFYWSTYGQALHPHPSIPPSYCCLNTPFLLMHRCSVLFSVAHAGLTVHSGAKDGSDLMLCLPTSLTAWPWFVIYTLIGTKLTHLGCVATKRKRGWGEGEAERQLKPEVALSRLGPWRRSLSRRHFSRQQQQCLMTSPASCFLLKSCAVLD